MTQDNWLTVAMIIAVIITAAATLLGPVLAVIVQVRASQPKPAPSESQPSNLDQDFRGRLKMRERLYMIAVFVCAVTLVFNLLILVRDMRLDTPITRKVIFQISLAVSVTLINAMAFPFIIMFALKFRAEKNAPETTPPVQQ